MAIQTNGAATPQSPSLWSDRDGARYLGISIVTFRRYYQTGKLPVHRLGKKVYCVKSELDRALGLPAQEADHA